MSVAVSDMPVRRRPRIAPGRAALTAVCILVFAFLVFPIAIVFPISLTPTGIEFPPSTIDFGGYVTFFASNDWLEAVLLSARVALFSTLLALPLGTAAAFGLVRSRSPLKRYMNSLILAPLMIPHIIIALALFFLYKDWGLFDSEIGIVLAHSVLIVPFIVIGVSASLKGFDVVLETAAMTMGANWWQALRYVTLPIVWPGILAGSLLAFITSFDEVVVALFVTGRVNETLPVKMFATAQQEIDPMLSVVSTLLIVFSVLVGLGITAATARRSAVSA